MLAKWKGKTEWWFLLQTGWLCGIHKKVKEVPRMEAGLGIDMESVSVSFQLSCLQDKISDPHNFKEKFIWFSFNNGFSPWLPAPVRERYGRGNLLTMWWPGRQESREEELEGKHRPFHVTPRHLPLPWGPAPNCAWSHEIISGWALLPDCWASLPWHPFLVPSGHGLKPCKLSHNKAFFLLEKKKKKKSVSEYSTSMMQIPSKNPTSESEMPGDILVL